MVKRLFVFLLVLALSIASWALEIDGNTVTINNASDFIELSSNVNKKGEKYAGSTILLGADIDFTNYSEQFEPIGVNNGTYFQGKFDGQGHTISNLRIVSPNQNVGLFGVTNGTNFKNLVVDASCSIKSIYNFSLYYGYTSGIIAYILPNKRNAESIIENLVNMAAVTFAGRYTTKQSENDIITISVSGIVGFILPDITNNLIRNCVNYGTITHSGHCEYASIGGIFGSLFRQTILSKTSCDIKNCANFGDLVHDGETEGILGMGGIIGASLASLIENCMVFSMYRVSFEVKFAGKVIGGTSSLVTVNNCYWTNEADVNTAWGFEYADPPPKGTNIKLVEANKEVLNALNGWVENNANRDGSNNYSEWIVLYLNGGYMSSVNANTSTFFTLSGFPVPDPSKDGHNFSYWCLDSDCTDGPATEEEILNESTTELYAMWHINNYTVAFYLDNGTIIEMALTYNEIIVPPDMTGVKGFHGWNLTYERMPGFDLIIVPNNPPEKKSKAGAIAGGVVGGVAGVAIIVLIILFIVLRKTKDGNDMMMDRLNKNADTRSRFIDEFERNDDDNSMVVLSKVEESPSEFVGLYSGYFKVPSISEALVQAGLDGDKAKCVESSCRDVAKRAESEGILSPAFTLDDAAAVALYTYDFGLGHLEINPYRLLNKALASENSTSLKRVRSILYIVMCALRKLPRCEGKTLYRGLRESIDKDVYANGKIVVWRRLTSTSTDMKAVKSFLDSSMKQEKSAGTLFVIDGWGYNIQPYSLFPDEEEILLEPNRQFIVSGVIESDVTIVNMRMLDMPLVLPEIFGDGSN